MRGRAVAILAVAAILAAIACGVPGLRGPERADVPVDRARRGPFVREVRAEGILVAEEATPLSVPTTARRGLRIAWLAEDGSFVKQGETVVRFDPTEMETRLYEGRADLATVDSKSDRTRLVETAALGNLERDAALAGLELDYADTFQSKDPDIFSRIEIIESRIDRDLATHRRDHAMSLHGIRSELLGVELDLLGLERRSAELQIEEAREGLSGLEIRAPHDGIFILRRQWGEAPAVGEVVWRGQPVAEIPRLARMKAQVYVLEADAGGLQTGAPARVRLESRPDLEFEGRVRTVSALAKRRSRWSPVQYFDAEVELDRTDPAVMKPGQRIRAEILLERHDDVLTVARDALFDGDDGERFVWRRQGGGFERVAVTTGSTALGRVIVESGLEAGDLVALGDPEATTAEPAPASGVGGGGAPALPGAAP